MPTTQHADQDGRVTIRGKGRRAVSYSGENGGVWYLTNPFSTVESFKWRKAGEATARTFRADPPGRIDCDPGSC
jgi:hypothetical protein